MKTVCKFTVWFAYTLLEDQGKGRPPNECEAVVFMPVPVSDTEVIHFARMQTSMGETLRFDGAKIKSVEVVQ